MGRARYRDRTPVGLRVDKAVLTAETPLAFAITLETGAQSITPNIRIGSHDAASPSRTTLSSEAENFDQLLDDNNVGNGFCGLVRSPVLLPWPIPLG